MAGVALLFEGIAVLPDRWYTFGLRSRRKDAYVVLLEPARHPGRHARFPS